MLELWKSIPSLVDRDTIVVYTVRQGEDGTYHYHNETVPASEWVHADGSYIGNRFVNQDP